MSGKNIAASVKQRLLNISHTTGEDFQSLLLRYAVERLLDRLARSEYAPRFILKGALLFALWTGRMHRPTRDLDLLGFGDPGADELARVFRTLCSVAAPNDGLTFVADTVAVHPIREDQEYGGQRVTMTVLLGAARIPLQVDVGFGDAVTPPPRIVDYPTLLGMDPPRLRAYAPETSVAEKLHAMATLGLTNSRMKDFYDLLILSRALTFAGPVLRDAIAATFRRRGTPLILLPPVALTDTFATDEAKKAQWQAFRRRSGLADTAPGLDEVIHNLASFLLPPLQAAASSVDFLVSWRPGGPWQAAEP